ncbi:MAG: hypothetical protein A2176_14590 [Spirochaetes bacterium RBG_13_51_14]|nr:MAG: hypothetical protein A2176_14590 [Spirochaetes bacterium RBG_13_51_14]
MNIGINWGNTFILVSFLFSLVALAFAIATASGRETFIIPSRILYLLASLGIFASILILLYYFITFDYRFVYVYGNSSRDLPLIYRIAAVWAGKEGSFLLWLFFLNAFGIIIIHRNEKTASIVTSVILLAQICILVILIVESPFLHIWEKYPDSFSPGLFPGDGAGMNPLLRDPWMVVHPPVLFLGYASSAVPFGHAIAALVKKEYREWIKAAYPWLLFSMVSLGIGIFLGGYWAYTVLGWGGYWGWDPVENSSLIPWVAALALVHGFLIQRRHAALVRTNLFLAIIYFISILYSTWLTRSGVLSNFSVHSFAASDVAAFLFAFLMVFAIGSAALFIMRYRTIAGATLHGPILDPKTLTVYGIIVLAFYALIIATGTSMPLITRIFMQRPANVTEAFYNNFSKPFGMLMLTLMFLSTTMSITRRKELLAKESIGAAIASIFLGVLINAGFTRSPFAYIFSILSFFLIVRAGVDLWKTKLRASLPSRITHIGVGVLVLGIITSNFHATAAQKKLIQDREYDIESIRITFKGFKEGRKSSMRFAVRDGSTTSLVETPYYFDEKMESIYKEPYIIAGFMHDTYIAPEQYESGRDTATTMLLEKGEEKVIGGIRIRFMGFRTEHMTSGEPSTYADLMVNGMALSPGIKFSRKSPLFLDTIIPGTDRSVSLREIDATSKRIFLNITPGKNTIIPPDTVLVTVTKKRLIWLVWLGTIIIACGGIYALGRSIRKKE